MRKLKFPSYEWLKSLPTTEDTEYGILPADYRWTLFDTPVSTTGILSYNEDGSGCIFFDVWEDGYTDQNELGLAFKLNKKNYIKLCKHAQDVYERFVRELQVDWCSWEEEGGESIMI